MKTSSQNTWRRELLEIQLGLSRGTTYSCRNLQRPGHHHRLAEKSFKQHCVERYHALCPTAATAEVVGRNIMFIRGEAMALVWRCLMPRQPLCHGWLRFVLGYSCALPCVP